MISAVDVWTFVHILLFVYWLGADLGVFVAAQAAKRSTLTYPQRSTALQLALKVDIAPRLERLLLALTVAYTLAVLLGAGPAARRVRTDCEVLRTTPRHGTRRRLSALTVGILLLSLMRFAALAARTLSRLLTALARGTPAVRLAVCPP